MKHSTPKPIAPRPATPPLPGDLAQQLNAGLRSRNADRKQAAMEACLAARAFAAGFCRGADPERACRRYVIGPHHEHWLTGYHAGLRAAEDATQRYLRDQLQPAATPRDDSATAATDACSAAPTPRPPRARASRTTRAPLPPQLTLFSRGHDMASPLPELTLRRHCAGRCGTLIAYVLEPGPFAPDLHSDGLIAYKDGHLCAACESAVEASLASRRTAIAAAEFTGRRGPAT